MICENTVRKYCCEDISLIENYYEAVNDKTQTWHCHHRLEIQDNISYSVREMIEMKIYYDRPAKELIFVTKSMHRSLHNKTLRLCGEKHPMYGKHFSENARKNMSISHIGQYAWNKGKSGLKRKPNKRFKWITSTGEIVEMCKGTAHRYHPDWKLIE